MASYFRKRYSRVPENETERVIDSIEDIICDCLIRPGKSILPALQKAAGLIHRRFECKEVAIGLRDPDGLFRMKVFIGYTANAKAAYGKIAYTYEEMTEESLWPGIYISKHSEFTNIRDVEGERDTLNRPSMINTDRESIDQFKGGDIIDIHITCGGEKNLLGWIRLSKTKDDKLPSRIAIKWIELIASTLGRIIWERAHPSK